MTEHEHVGFLVAGAQKCGTSALDQHLRGIPSLALPSVKEPHFFDDDRQDWSDPNISAYHKRFPHRPGLRGEATPIYTYWPESLERIARYNPAMKLIVLLRDPVERAWSHWRMEFARGADTMVFSSAIREGRCRVSTDAASRHGAHRVYSYVERGLYAAQVRRCLQLFGEAQVLFLPSECLRDTPAAAMMRIGEFLGVEVPMMACAPRRVHVAPEIDYGSSITDDDRAYLDALFADDRQQLFEMLTPDALPSIEQPNMRTGRSAMLLPSRDPANRELMAG